MNACRHILIALSVVTMTAALLARQNDRSRNPLAADSTAVAAGQRLFDQTCQTCHGPAGRGESGPALNTGTFTRGSNDVDLFRTIRGGVAGSQMPAFKQFSDEQVWQVTQVADSMLGYSITSAPLVVKDKVIVGVSGGGSPFPDQENLVTTHGLATAGSSAAHRHGSPDRTIRH